MLNIRYKRIYKKSTTGKVMFVYHVSGDQASLDQFETIQGEHYRTDNGTPVWFTSRFVGESCKLLITSAGKIVADTSEFDKAKSLADQFGGNLGQAIADAAAAKLVQPTDTPPSAPEHTAPEPTED